MSRRSRVVIPGCPHHVTQRGNNRRDVFFSDVGRETYIKLLRRYCTEYEVGVVGYCLMSNHVHLIATPEHEKSLARAFGRAHNDYSRWLNVSRGESGHLLAKPILFLRAGSKAPVGGISLRGAKPGTRGNGNGGGKVAVVECRGALKCLRPERMVGQRSLAGELECGELGVGAIARFG